MIVSTGEAGFERTTGIPLLQKLLNYCIEMAPEGQCLVLHRTKVRAVEQSLS
jgi:hypothetical protein